MPAFVTAIPVGPGRQEVERAADLLDALRAHEPRTTDVVLVDDEPQARRTLPAATAVLESPRRGRGIGTLGGTCTATFTALAWAHRARPGAWVLRLDTDALVIGPVADRVEAAFAEHPQAGVLGSCHRTCGGEERNLDWWDPVVRKHARRVWLWRRPPLGRRHVDLADPLARDVVRRAVARAGAPRPGAHCMAAGCAISAPFLAALAGAGALERPERWLRTLFGDDVLLGTFATALGFDLVDLHAVFGLQHVGLVAAPPELAARGFGVVHSVKNDDAHPEDEIRAFFRERRVAPS
ncbi:hypothetical protein [Conexibacter sp. SYSU D00693]|uniref:hypothetical protein n=1 Tax=Conexibacter sp. SYSU D00693 TaxID=2812560 RepID=UPI00196AA0B2|nr:hypothetical protein [Conexibacter sp. SYSU D00693]